MSKEVYIIAQIQVKDYPTYFKEYALKFKDILPAFQGEVLSATTKAEVIEGTSYGNWTVLIKFPSLELAHACIHSEEYAPLAAIRINELTTGNNVFIIPAKKQEN